MTNSIACDANILLELLENRAQADKVRKAMARHARQGVIFAISALTASHVFYLAEAHKLPVKQAEELIRQFRVFDVTAADIEWALTHYEGKDFEDGLQVAAALRENCSVFITLDGLLSRRYGSLIHVELIAG